MSEEEIKEEVKEEVVLDPQTSMAIEIEALKQELENARKMNENTMKMVNEVIETNKRLLAMLNKKDETPTNEKSDMEIAEESFKKEIKEEVNAEL